MPKDNWGHHYGRSRCTSCMWFMRKTYKEPSGYVISSIGRCRKRAPTLNGFPVMYDTDWCGDHKLDSSFFKQKTSELVGKKLQKEII